MLTFTRKNGQSVVVQVAGHPPLTITFLGSRPGKCQLAFDGPQDYHILREEIAQRDSLLPELDSIHGETACRQEPSGCINAPLRIVSRCAS